MPLTAQCSIGAEVTAYTGTPCYILLLSSNVPAAESHTARNPVVLLKCKTVNGKEIVTVDDSSLIPT